MFSVEESFSCVFEVTVSDHSHDFYRKFLNRNVSYGDAFYDNYQIPCSAYVF